MRGGVTLLLSWSGFRHLSAVTWHSTLPWASFLTMVCVVCTLISNDICYHSGHSATRESATVDLLLFLPQYRRQLKRFWELIKALRDTLTSVALSVACTLIDNSKLDNQIATFLPIVMKSNSKHPLDRQLLDYLSFLMMISLSTYSFSPWRRWTKFNSVMISV